MKKDDELLEACRVGNLSLVEKLLAPNKSNPWSLSNLGLRSKVSVNCHDHSGYTPLHHAALNGHKEIVCALLHNAASTNITDNKRNSPLHLAAWSGFHEIVSSLLTHGPSIAKVNDKNGDSETALHCAAQHGHTQVANILLQKGADSTMRNIRGESPLDLASQYGRLDVVKLLLFYQPSLLKYFPESFSPLHVASRNGHKQIVELLLAHGADVNCQNDNGTPLHEASLFGKLDVVKLLLSRGANPHALNSQHQSSLELVQHLDTQISKKIAQVLLDRLRDGDDYVPLLPVGKSISVTRMRTSCLYPDDVRAFTDGQHQPVAVSSEKIPDIRVESHYVTPGSSSTHPARNRTFKGLSRGWSRSSGRKFAFSFRKSASVRCSKSLPRLPSAQHDELSSSGQQCLSSCGDRCASHSMLSLPVTVPSRTYKPQLTSNHGEDNVFSPYNNENVCSSLNIFTNSQTRVVSCTAHNSPALVTTNTHQQLHSTCAHSDVTMAESGSVDKTPERKLSSLPGGDAVFTEGSASKPPVGRKPPKPMRQKLSTVTSPPLPPKCPPLHNTGRPPSPLLPPPLDDDDFDLDNDEVASSL